MTRKKTSIRKCDDKDFDAIYQIINEAASAYKGVIPTDRWREPYMPKSELRHEMSQGVRFWGCEENENLLGVMGIQDIEDVSLIRHAYVRKARQNQGIGKKLLNYLCNQTGRPVLVGTWADATWAISFYERNGFKQVTEEAKDKLLRKYWTIPERQIKTSVVLVDKKYQEL